MKTTKKQAREIYDEFNGVLRWLNGGTSKENGRSAARCFARLQEVAAKAVVAVETAGEPLQADSWLFDALKTLPERADAFGERYGIPAVVEPTEDEKIRSLASLQQ